MVDEQKREDLVAAIYDAAIDPGRWTCVLRQLSAALQARASVLFLNRGPELVFTVTEGFDPVLLERAAEFQKQDEYLKRRRRASTLRAVTGAELIPYDTFRRTAFFHEVAKPLGSAHLCGATLRDDSERLAAVSVYRPDGYEDFGPGEAALLQSLTPHFLRAVSIMDRLETADRRSDEHAQALDRLPMGFLLLDGRGKILHLNQAAADILERGDDIGRRGGYLSASSPENSETLRVLLARATGRIGPAEGTSAILKRQAGGPLQIRAAPARPMDSPFFRVPERTAAIVILVDPDRRTIPPYDLLRALYGLSPAEARLACVLAEGGSLPEFAAEKGVSLNTARSQLKSVFRKTGIDRQTGLVRLITRWSMWSQTEDQAAKFPARSFRSP